MVKRLFGRPETAWLISAVVASVLLAATLFVPLWEMELVAPQYPEGLVMRAYGFKFADDPGSYYDDIREINGLNHYIGMKPIEEVTEMKLFIPGIVATIGGAVLVSFVSWKRNWFRALVIGGFWFIPIFFVVDLQYWLYHYGHTLSEEAALNMDPFTPKVWGETKVWNFHSQTGFDIGFYLMLASAAVITFLPPIIRAVQRRMLRSTRSVAAPSGGTPQAAQRA